MYDTQNANLTKTYVIGDVHGCFHTLQNLIAKLPKDAQLIFVGDLCDKGNYSKEVISYVIDNGYTCIKGNHEQLMQTHLQEVVNENKHSMWSSDYRYGGTKTYGSYIEDEQTMQRHLRWIEKLPLYIQKEHYFITHGYGLPFYMHRDNPKYHDKLLLNRYENGVEVPQSEVINIFGHCVFDEVVKGDNFYGIDTGCAYGNKLTALQLGTMDTIQEPMDRRDSEYEIKKMQLHHLEEIVERSTNLEEIIVQIDIKFDDFNLISSEVLTYIIDNFPSEADGVIYEMLKKKQIFNRQARKFIKGFNPS